MRPGKLDPATFRILADDDAVTLEYGPGVCRLTAPAAGPDDPLTALWTRRYRELPGKLAAAGARRLVDGPAMAVPVPKWTDAGKARALTVADLATYAVPDKADPGRCHDVVGQTCGAYRVVRTDGRAAVFTLGGGDTAVRMGIGDPAALPVRAILSAAWWRAYARVRTCRPPRSQAVYLELGDHGCLLRTADLDDGIEAREYVPADPFAADSSAHARPYVTCLSDRYLWPLRGAAGVLHQETPTAPVWIGGLDPLAVVIMPMRL